MRVKPSVNGYFALLLLGGMVLGGWIHRSLHVRVALPIEWSSMIGGGTLASFALGYAALMRLPLLVFLTGYTIFAPAVCSLVCLYLGVTLGAGGNGMLPVGAVESFPLAMIIAGLVICLLVLCGQAATHRMHLRTSAPDARALLHGKPSMRYLAVFLLICSINLLSTAVIVFVIS